MGLNRYVTTARQLFSAVAGENAKPPPHVTSYSLPSVVQLQVYSCAAGDSFTY